MKILALDSSGIVASVAVIEDDILLAEYTVNYKKTHSQTLLPMLDEVVKMTELDLETIDAIAVAAGPGSFTGLRIGSATAKGLGLALKKPLIAVPTVDALAYNLYDVSGLICPIMDARRNQVYTGIYRFEEHKLVAVKQQWASPVTELIEELNKLGEPVTFLGDGVPVFRSMIEGKLQVPYSFAAAMGVAEESCPTLYKSPTFLISGFVARMSCMMASVFRKSEVPVMLAPGACREFTSPTETGSETAANTTGVPLSSVADCIAMATGVATATIRSTRSASKFEMIWESRLASALQLSREISNVTLFSAASALRRALTDATI